MNKPKIFAGKRILITSYSYASFGGAELNAVELADQLVLFGMKPTFFSYDIDGPLKNRIEERFKTNVLTDHVQRLSESEDEDDMGITKLDINDYDYIWVGGNTVPISILRQINTAKKLPKFIFIHMSPLIAFPLDAPLMPDFERKISSKILSISEKTTTDNIQRILGEDTPVGYWRNPVPMEYKNLKKRNGELQKIAVISSSHPSSEIMGIKHIIERRGIRVDYVGRFVDNVQEVNANFYDNYDLIVGIGKNSKYSLVSGVPVYIYGRFGGGGYINESNLKLNEMYNFSGRGFDRRDAATIVNEIIAGYHDALNFHEKNRDAFIEELSLDNVASKLFIELEQQKNEILKIEEQYINWLISVQINIMQRIQLSAGYRNAQAGVHELERVANKLQKENNVLRRDLSGLTKHMKVIENSQSWRITKPLRSTKHQFKLVLKKLNQYTTRNR